jgi:hypothetical protein
MCPSCKVGLFPANNLVSPVADVLREKLAGVNWARAGLGLPLVNYSLLPYLVKQLIEIILNMQDELKVLVHLCKTVLLCAESEEVPNVKHF